MIELTTWVMLVRNPYFDNAKFILIVLVVVGHVIGVIEDRFLQALTRVIYSFHMPVFTFIAGYFHKQIKSKEILSHLGLYVVFQAVYLIIRFILNKNNLELGDFLNPYYIMWFLFSLITWKLITPYIARIKYAVVLLVVASVLAGYLPSIGTFLSISRTIFLFPFFLLGYLLQTKPIIKINKAVGYTILTILLICFYYLPTIKLGWFSGPFSYSLLGANQWYAGLYRIGIYAVLFMGSIAFLSIVPSGKHFFTEFGRKTMTVYLLHGIPIHALYLMSFFVIIDDSLEKFIATVLALAWALLLAYLPFKRNHI